MRFVYPVEITEHRGRRAKETGFAVAFPDLPEALTWGNTWEKALEEAVDCLEEALAGRITNREDLPAPQTARGRPTVVPGSLIAAKAALYLALGKSGLKQKDLAALLGVHPRAVTRLLDPAHASKPDQFDAAFKALGARLVVSLEGPA